MIDTLCLKRKNFLRNVGSEEMKKHQHAFLVSSILFIGLLIITPFVVSHFFVPSQIRLIVGKEHMFNFEVPIKVDIHRLQDQAKKDQVIIKNHKDEIIEDQLIALNQPLSLTMLEEGSTDVTLSLFGVIPLKTVSVQAMPYEELIPCGEVVGIKIDTSGVLVLGVGEFESDTQIVSPCKGIIEVGDLIVACNGKNVESKEDFRSSIETCESAPINLTVSHKGHEREVTVTPSYCSSDKEYKIGLWIKDSTQGIGTVTFINPRSGFFGALGHGISDSQTHTLTPIKSGEIMEVAITHITKGEKGEPGELSGIIDYDFDSRLGKIAANHPLGIYGKVDQQFIDAQKHEAVPIAFQDEVHEGKASILVDLTGEGVKEYEVDIQKVSKYSSEPSKGMVIKIVDEDLLALTNGIVQGMSGSPILQDGRLIGAVTHVFIHDPTRGYGIFIESMINNEIN